VSTTDAVKDPDTLAEALLGREVLAMPALARFRAWPAAQRAALVAALLGALVLLPYLGAVGLWDPWETHYGEVAREMMQRNDYVHPYWENAWFFSKPVFTMWMMAAGMQGADAGPMAALGLGGALLALGLALFLGKVQGASPLKEFWGAVLALPGVVLVLLGVYASVVASPWKFAKIASGDGALPLFTEWGFRLPFATFSIVALALLTYALARLVSPRAGLATAVVLVTMPLYFLISRQAVTDTPFVSALISGMACTLVALLDHETKFRSEWWYAAYVFFAISTLAKGLLGFGIPMVVMALLAAIWFAWAPAGSPRWFDMGDHIEWALKHGGIPVLIAAGAGNCAGLVASRWGHAERTVFMAVPLGDNNQPIVSSAAWLGIMWGSLVFWAVATLLIGRELRKSTRRPPALFQLMSEMRLGTGILLFLGVCLPWYYHMFTFPSVDDEGKLFWYRFIVHDHFARLGAGVHTTTPGGDFTYFILQGGYAIFPWVILLPGAFSVVGRLGLRRASPVDIVGLAAVLWFAIAWGLIGASATKFHHYVLPMLPPVAILMGIFVDRVWEEGVDQYGIVILLGVPFAVLVGKDLSGIPKNFTDLFVYNYDRPYPQFLMERVISTTSSIAPGFLSLLSVAVGLTALVSQLMLLVGLFKMDWRRGLAGILFPIYALIHGLAYGDELEKHQKPFLFSYSQWATAQLFSALLSVLALASWKGMALKSFMGVCLIVAGVVLAFMSRWGSRTSLFTAGLTTALVFALWFNWGHWVDLSHHWTQRDQFWRYYTNRRPGEPIAAFLMNWRGETFYSRNTVKQIKDNANVGMYNYAQQPGRKWALVEHNRLGILKGAVGADKNVTLIDKDLNNKFVLVTIE
jgi:4-amino-4-deoxy-L-arabinose transferase-like glycosyltransferase